MKYVYHTDIHSFPLLCAHPTNISLKLRIWHDYVIYCKYSYQKYKYPNKNSIKRDDNFAFSHGISISSTTQRSFFLLSLFLSYPPIWSVFLFLLSLYLAVEERRGVYFPMQFSLSLLCVRAELNQRDQFTTFPDSHRFQWNHHVLIWCKTSVGMGDEDITEDWVSCQQRNLQDNGYYVRSTKPKLTYQIF